MRKAIENKFHKSLDQLASDLIFKPLQTKDTKFFWDNTVDETRFEKPLITNCGNGSDAFIHVIQKYLEKEGEENIDVETK